MSSKRIARWLLAVQLLCGLAASCSKPGGEGAAGGGVGLAAMSGTGGVVASGGSTGGSPFTAGTSVGNGEAGSQGLTLEPSGAGAAGTLGSATSWTVTSPQGVVRGTVELGDKGGIADYPAGRARLYYRVEVGGPDAYVAVLEESPLGLSRSDQDFVDGLVFDGATEETVIDEPYILLTGKRSSIRNPARERVLSFRTPTGGGLQLVIRAYDDGFAFRYRFPETSASISTVTGEATGFRPPPGSRGFMLPYDLPGMYTPGYEAFWQSDIEAGTAAPPMTAGWCMPALFRTPEDHWLLLAETDLDGTYFGAHLGPMAPSSVYRIALPEAGEANALGTVNPSSTLPWQTPWRVVIAGSSLAPIVESTLTTDLARPTAIADTSWVRPGRSSWSWWSDDSSSSDYDRLLPFVDLAANMGWEYSLVDVNWNVMTNGTWQELATYAAARNVGLFLWYGSGGPHNSVLQYGPRDLMNDPARRRAEFQTLAQAGIKGVKIDFFLSDKPWMIQYYLDILKDAADYQLLVNFHGATVPRGWQRTYPNLVTMEAVRGAEEYKYTAMYPAGQPGRNTVLPFTRNVIGSMDFTPVTFTDALYPHVTTSAHELALSVVFESGVQHFADRVSGYETLPDAPRTFLQQVPVAWDDTRFVGGAPGGWVALARRKDTSWYLAGIDGGGNSGTVAVNLAFLGAGAFDMTMISDGASDRTFAEQAAVVTASDPLTVSIRPNGGFVARFTPAPP